MAHVISQNYRKLQKRLNRFAQGAPESSALYKILEVLFTEQEARMVSSLPIRFFTANEAAKRWKIDEAEARKLLNTLADKGILMDFRTGETQSYLLAPTMAGFFEFSLMRTDGRFDRKLLSKLYYDYINQEEDFVNQIFGLKTPIDRVFVHEDMVRAEDRAEILDYEKASHIIESASCITVGTCYCRHKMEHVGKACDKPMEVCLTFNKAAESLSSHNIARKIPKEEAFKILEMVMKEGLVQLGDNVQSRVNWICNCCGCCCEGLLSYKRLGYQPAIHSNFLAEIDSATCNGCGICAKRCPVDAIELIGEEKKDRMARVDWNRCIGCGVCARFCKTQSIAIKRRDELNFTPVDTFERYVRNAIETGKLPNYLLDNFDLWTYDILRKFLGIIVSLSPVKKILAMEQLQSRYLQILARTDKYDLFDKLYNEGRRVDYSHPELRKQNRKK